MASSKPTILVRTEHEIIEKMKVIAKANNRSISKETEMLIKKHISRYEDDYGEIHIEKKD